jgi:ribonucleoside-diphosphate reductase alpha chain
VSLKKKYVSQLPVINKRKSEAKTVVIEDSIEGWAESIKVLISSYCKHESLYEEYYGSQIKFDYSNIRPKGAYITGGFKAPGPDGLKLSLERIEKLIDKNLNNVEVIDYLMNSNITPNAMSASIMNLIYKKNIKAEKILEQKD